MAEVSREIRLAHSQLASWVYPHKNQSSIQYKGHTIEVAQRVRDETWSWAVAGEDNGGVKSREEAVRQAKSMVDSITRDWD